MEIEESGVTSSPRRGKKRPSSPSAALDKDEYLSESITSSDDDNSSEEGEDHEDQGANYPFTVDRFPKASCDDEEQWQVTFRDPETMLRGPRPIKRYPPFKGGEHMFGGDYNLHNKSETTFNSVEDCSDGCRCRPMFCLLQFVDIKIAGYKHVQSGCANIFGFVAVRDQIEPLRNYVYRREIQDCEAVSVKRKTGVARLSLNSPTRVISILSRALIEFELYVQTKALPEDEPKCDCLIDGCTEFTNLFESDSFVEHRRMYGEWCALDVKYMVLVNAVEARVEVKVLRLGTSAGGVNMKLLAKTSRFNEVLRLFRGAAPEPGSIMTFVVAVERRNNLDIHIEAAARGDPFVGKEKWQYSFQPSYHDIDEKEAELGEFAKVSVKVIWKSYSRQW